MATRFNFRVFRGDSASFSLPFTLDDEPYSLEGAVVFFTAKLDNQQSDDDALIRKSSDDGGISIEDAAAGEAVLLLDPEDMEDLPVGEKLYCDVQVVTAGGATYTVATGRMTIVEDTTIRRS